MPRLQEPPSPLLLDNTPPPPRTPSPNHPMSAGYISRDGCLYPAYSVVRPQPTPQQAEFRPRPAPQERSLCPKSACWSKRRWSSSFRSPYSGDQASGFQTRGLFLSLSVDVAPPLLPGSGSEPQMGGAGLAPQKPRKGRRPAQHVAHVSVPLPTPSAPLPPRPGSDVVPCAFFPPWPYFSASGLLPPVFSRPHLLFSQVPAMHRLSFSSPVQ